MSTYNGLKRSIPVVVLAVAGMAAFVPPAHAATSIQSLVAQAEHNTNTVRTLVHHDQWTITAPNGSLKVSAHGAEDEVKNREQDYESVHVTSRAASGKVSKLNYAVDLIFMNGLTYYRISSAPTQWKTQKGMKFADPYTHGWQRGRTTVKVPARFVFKQVGAGGGQTHVRASSTTKTVTESVDLWITTGAKPYVVREDIAYHDKNGTEVSQIKFGPFNSNLNIQPPAQASA
jgi:hypothetical protein